MIFFEENKVIFDQPPTMDALKNVLLKIFGANYNEGFIARVKTQIERFLAKGRAIYISDLQDIIQRCNGNG